MLIRGRITLSGLSIPKRKLFLFAIVALILFILFAILNVLINALAVPGMLAALLFMALIGWHVYHMRWKTARELDDRNLQAIIGLYHCLKPISPLPLLRGSAISADAGHEYVRLIRRHRPEVIVELGSGSSTVLAGYQVKQNGAGRIIAIDHHPFYCGLSRDLIAEHGLEDVAEVRHAPMITFDWQGSQTHWYDPDSLKDIEKIDLLFIDGPIDVLDKGARMPAFEVLRDRLAENAVIYVDDCHRPHYRKMVYEWARNNGYECREQTLFDKRNITLIRNVAPASDGSKSD